MVVLERFASIEESDKALEELCKVVMTEKCAKVREALYEDTQRFLQLLMYVPKSDAETIVLARLSKLEEVKENMAASSLHAGLFTYLGTLRGIFIGLKLAEHAQVNNTCQ